MRVSGVRKAWGLRWQEQRALLQACRRRHMRSAHRRAEHAADTCGVPVAAAKGSLTLSSPKKNRAGGEGVQAGVRERRRRGGGECEWERLERAEGHAMGKQATAGSVNTH